MKYAFLSILFLTSATAFAQKGANLNKKLLPGSWVSMDDKKYTIEITDSTFIEYYSKKKTDTYSYKIKGDKLTKTDKQYGDVYQYSIVTLSAQNFTLLYLDRGNMLKFIRKK